MKVTISQLRGMVKETLLAEKKKKKKKKKKGGKKDACYHKVKSRYDVWPSAYASGALVKCRKVGAKNWGNSKKEGVEDDYLRRSVAQRHQRAASEAATAKNLRQVKRDEDK